MSILGEAEEAASAVAHGTINNVTKIASGGLSSVSLPVRLTIYGILIAAVALAVGRIYSAGYDASTDHWQAEMAKAEEKYKKEKDDLQAKYDNRAADETAANLAKAESLVAAQRRLLQPKDTVQGAPTTKLPVDCVFDAERIKWANAE